MLGIPAGERLNTVTHGLGFLLSTIGTLALMARAVGSGDAWRVIGCGIFGLMLVATYGASTLSHAVARPAARRWFRILDQAFIYLLIVGSYTPFALVYLRTGWWWWAFFAVMWSVALWGFLSKLLLAHRVDAVTVRSHILLGWM